MIRSSIFTGTSNIILPGSRSTFPSTFQTKSRLHYYSSLFPTVELNSTFYKVPQANTFNRWANDVPPHFIFSIKLIKDITHEKHLTIDENVIHQFMNCSHALGSKKGCLLIQFPGKVTLQFFTKVEQILKAVSAANVNNEWKVVVEFRNAGWFISETMELLDEYEASLVLQDIPKSRNDQVNKKAPVVYMRFHGPAGDYKGNYELQFLRLKAQEVKAFARNGKDVYVYFNNGIGNGYENALQFKKLIDDEAL